MHRGLQLQAFAHDRHEHVYAHRDPNLRLHGILGCPVEGLDTQGLLDPFEEQLHLPAQPVELIDCERGQIEVVRQERQALAGLGVAIANVPQGLGG